MSGPQLQESYVFQPSPAGVTTIQYFLENAKLSKSFVDHNWDGIPPEDLAFCSCPNAGSPIPVIVSISTVH